MKTYMLQQFDYHVWANQQVCNYLKNLPDAVYRQKVDSDFPTIYDTLVHMYVVDRGWLSFLRAGVASDMFEEHVEHLKSSIDSISAETKGRSIEELGQMQEELAVRFRAFIEQLDDIEVIHPSGTFQARCVDYIQHVVNHGTYHRGNITTMLRQLGHLDTSTCIKFKQAIS